MSKTLDFHVPPFKIYFANFKAWYKCRSIPERLSHASNLRLYLILDLSFPVQPVLPLKIWGESINSSPFQRNKTSHWNAYFHTSPVSRQFPEHCPPCCCCCCYVASVVCDSVRPHGLQPTRLLCPWDFPGKSTGVGCHCLLQLPTINDLFSCSVLVHYAWKDSFKWILFIVNKVLSTLDFIMIFLVDS